MQTRKFLWSGTRGFFRRDKVNNFSVVRLGFSYGPYGTEPPFLSAIPSNTLSLQLILKFKVFASKTSRTKFSKCVSTRISLSEICTSSISDHLVYWAVISVWKTTRWITHGCGLGRRPHWKGRVVRRRQSRPKWNHGRHLLTCNISGFRHLPQIRRQISHRFKRQWLAEEGEVAPFCLLWGYIKIKRINRCNKAIYSSSLTQMLCHRPYTVLK